LPRCRRSALPFALARSSATRGRQTVQARRCQPGPQTLAGSSAGSRSDGWMFASLPNELTLLDSTAFLRIHHGRAGLVFRRWRRCAGRCVRCAARAARNNFGAAVDLPFASSSRTQRKENAVFLWKSQPRNSAGVFHCRSRNQRFPFVAPRLRGLGLPCTSRSRTTGARAGPEPGSMFR